MILKNLENQEVGYKTSLERKLVQDIKVGNTGISVPFRLQLSAYDRNYYTV
jgi:hypothetical protein